MEEESSKGDECTEKVGKFGEVEVHLYIRGKGPIHVFKATLGGWDEDRLDLQQIMDDYGLKALYAFSTRSGRGLRLRINPRNGLSILPYTGKLVCIDAEPKDSLIKPISKILLVLAVFTFLAAMVLREPPQWIHKVKFLGGGSFSWTVAIIIFVFSRLRKRIRDILKRYGW
eukprot:Gb_09091 [translate_table: standard]